MVTVRGRCALAAVLLLAVFLPGGRHRWRPEGLTVGMADLLRARSGQELEVPRPVRRFAPPIEPAPGRLRVLHHGPYHPARAAARVGEETWVGTPSGLLRFGSELWSAPGQARPLAACPPGRPASSPINDLRPLGPRVALATEQGWFLVERNHPCGRAASVALQGQRVTALEGDLVGTWSGLSVGGRLVPGSRPGLPVTGLRACGGRTYVATHDQGLLMLVGARLLPVPGLQGVRVASLSACQGSTGEVLAATTAGLFAVREGRARRVPGTPLHTTAALRLGEALLVAGFDQGLRLHSGEARPPSKLPVPGRVGLLLRGQDGAVLVGSDSGLFVWRPGSEPVRLPVDGPPPGPITALADGGEETLWVGTFDRGLARLRGERWESVPVFDPRITSLHRDRGGQLWVGTASGLGRLREGRVMRVADPRGWLRRHVASLRGSPVGDDPTLWAAVYPGLVAIDTSLDPPQLDYFGARGQEADAGLPAPTIYAVAPSAEGLWVASDDGLGRLTRAGTRLLTDLGGVLPDNWVNDLREEGGTLTALTLRSGLLRLSPAGSQVFAASLMTSPGVLLVHRGALLFGSNADGLIVLDETEEARPVLRSFGPAQGLPSSMVTSLLHDVARDRLWVGGSGGLTRIEGASRSLGLPRLAPIAAGGKEDAP